MENNLHIAVRVSMKVYLNILAGSGIAFFAASIVKAVA